MTEPENEPSCADGMAMDPDVTPGGPLDPRRTCGASVRDTVHAAHAPSAYDRTAAGKARAAVERSEANLCGCSRPDMSDDPHRHDRDDWCALWVVAGDPDRPAAKRAWVDGRMSRDRIDLAKRALAHCYFTDDEVSDDVAPRIREYASEMDRQLAAVRTEADEMAEALRLTVEYVGTDVLRPVLGWSWYDALLAYRPDVAGKFRDEDDARRHRDAEHAAMENVFVSKPPEPPDLDDDDAVRGVALDLQDPVTNIRVYRTGSWWKPWRAEITFRGMGLTTIRGWNEDTVETRAYAAVERAHRGAEKRRRTYRSIDIEGN